MSSTISFTPEASPRERDGKVQQSNDKGTDGEDRHHWSLLLSLPTKIYFFHQNLPSHAGSTPKPRGSSSCHALPRYRTWYTFYVEVKDSRTEVKDQFYVLY